MLTKQLREMERQADVVTVKGTLPSGSWMRKRDVLDYLYNQMKQVSLAHIVESILETTTTSNGTEYLNTSDIQNVVPVYVFREMECTVTTLMIIK
jgi:hypothetical protein